MEIIKMRNIIHGQIKIKVKPISNIGIPIGVVYALEVLDDDETEDEKFPYAKYEIVNVVRLNECKFKMKTALLKITYGNKKYKRKCRLASDITM